MRAFRSLFLLLAFAVVPPMPAQAEDIVIDWQLRFPFRLFNDYSDTAEGNSFFTDTAKPHWLQDWSGRRDLYVDAECQSAEFPILCSEEAVGPTRIEKIRTAIRPELDPEDNETLATILVAAGTRYDADKRHHYLTQAETAIVVDPSQQAEVPHKVWLFLTSTQSDWTCDWKIDGRLLTGPCSGTPANIKRTDNPSSTSRIEVVIKQQPGISVSGIGGGATLVKEHVIIGLGDSFGSGEGNPDIPARLDNAVRDKGWPQRPILTKGGTMSPENSRNAAYWLDRNCHRSLLSSQARAAIHFSAENPKREVSFIGVACSGGEIYEGVLGRYAGTLELSDSAFRLRSQTDVKARELWRLEMSQINQVLWALCADGDVSQNWEPSSAYRKNFETSFDRRKIECSELKRPVDAALISVGGNDSGFARVVAWLLTRNRVQQLALDPNIAKCLANPKSAPNCSSLIDTAAQKKCIGVGNVERCRAEAKIPLPSKFSTLNQSLKSSFGLNPARIILSQYPDPTKGTNQQTCGTAQNPYVSAGLERWPLKTNVVPQTLSQGFEDFTDEKPTIARSDLRNLSTAYIRGGFWPTIKAAASTNGWKLAEKHIAPFDRRGWCATRATPPHTTEDDLSLTAFRDKAVPKSGFSKFNAFAPTERWLRTVNDAYMTQNTHPSVSQLEATGTGFLSVLVQQRIMEIYGIFHPNALGAAATADAYLVRLREVFGTTKPKSLPAVQ